VVLQVVHGRVFVDQRIALRDVHADDQRVRLGLLVDRLADEHRSMHFERRCAPRRSLLDIRQAGGRGADFRKIDRVHRCSF